MLTGVPSTTRVRLVLGADLPCADYRGAGTLGLPAGEFCTRLIVTHVSIRTSDTSSALYSAPSPAYGTLPYHPPYRFPLCRGEEGESAASVNRFEPRYIFRAGRLDQ